MLSRWTGKAVVAQMRRNGSQTIMGLLNGQRNNGVVRNYAKVAAFDVPVKDGSHVVSGGVGGGFVEKGLDTDAVSMVNLDKMFWSKPCSLALAQDSPLRIEEPNYEGIKRFLLKMMLFYSKQSTSIRGANVVYKRVITQVDKPAIYNVFNLEKTFKTTFSLLVIHMWLCLRRLKEEGTEGVEFGQYVYEIYNHDLELRVSKAGVNLLLTKWMKDLERIFYGNLVAYDKALLPEAGKDDLSIVLWRNLFSDDPASEPSDAAKRVVQAMARYIRHEVACLSLTDKEAMLSGNFMFTSLNK